MLVKDLTHFEEQMRQSRGIKRGEMCKLLGISQAKWRRHIEERDAGDVVDDRTLGLAMAAVWAGMEPFGNMTFTLLAEPREVPATGPTAARVHREVRFITWAKEEPAHEAS